MKQNFNNKNEKHCVWNCVHVNF